MFRITLLTVGKLKEKFYLAAAEEYQKRLKSYCDFSLVELPETRLPDDPSAAQIAAGLSKEAELIVQKLPKGAWFCVLTPEGTELSVSITEPWPGLSPEGRRRAENYLADRVEQLLENELQLEPLVRPGANHPTERGRRCV